MKIFNGIKSLIKYWGWMWLIWVPLLILMYVWGWHIGIVPGLIETGFLVLVLIAVTITGWNVDEY